MLLTLSAVIEFGSKLAVDAHKRAELKPEIGQKLIACPIVVDAENFELDELLS